MENHSPFRKCSVSGCPYRATLNSTYCPKHLEIHEKKEKLHPFKPDKKMKFIHQRNDILGDGGD